MARGRPRKSVEPPVETPAPNVTPVSDTEAANGDGIKKRRRRRNIGPDYASETRSILDAVLRSRANRGATQEALNAAVTWARSVRAEGDALRDLANSPRRQKSQTSPDRQARHDMNKALLEGILAGEIALDVADNGDLIFLHNGGQGSIAFSVDATEA